MKFLKENEELSSKPSTEKLQEQQQEAKVEFDSVIYPYENHKLFEIDVATNEIRLAEFEIEPVIEFDPYWTKKKTLNKRGKVIKKEGCVYISALNKKTAIKKFSKGNNGSKRSDNDRYLSL